MSRMKCAFGGPVVTTVGTKTYQSSGFASMKTPLAIVVTAAISSKSWARRPSASGFPSGIVRSSIRIERCYAGPAWLEKALRHLDVHHVHAHKHTHLDYNGSA